MNNQNETNDHETTTLTSIPLQIAKNDIKDVENQEVEAIAPLVFINSLSRRKYNSEVSSKKLKENEDYLYLLLETKCIEMAIPNTQITDNNKDLSIINSMLRYFLNKICKLFKNTSNPLQLSSTQVLYNRLFAETASNAEIDMKRRLSLFWKTFYLFIYIIFSPLTLYVIFDDVIPFILFSIISFLTVCCFKKFYLKKKIERLKLDQLSTSMNILLKSICWGSIIIASIWKFLHLDVNHLLYHQNSCDLLNNLNDASSYFE